MVLTITLADILSATEVLVQKEATDKAALEGIGQIDIDTLRAKLIQWGISGFPSGHVVHELVIATPSVCSDGVSRMLGDYIEFCSGKTIHQHIDVLRAFLPDIAVSFTCSGSNIQIVVTRPSA